jgi:hypothetical protein
MNQFKAKQEQQNAIKKTVSNEVYIINPSQRSFPRVL